MVRAGRQRGAGVETAARPAAPARDRGWRPRVPAAFAATLTLLAALCAVAAVSEAAGTRIQPVRATVDQLLLPAPANLGYAALVFVLGAGVARRKRVAYAFLVAYFALQLCWDLLALVALSLLSPADWGSQVPPWWAGPGATANLLVTVAALVVLYLARR